MNVTLQRKKIFNPKNIRSGYNRELKNSISILWVTIGVHIDPIFFNINSIIHVDDRRTHIIH